MDGKGKGRTWIEKEKEGRGGKGQEIKGFDRNWKIGKGQERKGLEREKGKERGGREGES